MTAMTDEPGPGKSRVAILGEFSAGKSTLTNILLGASHSPMRVTATRMAPILYVAGNGEPVRVLADGSEEPVARADLAQVPLDGTRYVRVPLTAPILDRIDLMDMPGSSDPNMSTDIWNDLLPLADIGLWCTPASQAWRQSEAALWDTVDARVQRRSLILLTRTDKVSGQKDLDRLMVRVRRETRGLFRAVVPVSLVGPDGAPAPDHAPDMAAFMAAFRDVIENAEPKGPERVTVVEPERRPEPKATIVPRRVSALPAGAARTRRAGDEERLI